MTLRYWQVDAFANGPFSGNPAAVIALPHAFPPERMAAMAAETGLPATAFVLPPADGGALPIRWFSPRGEIRLCGHGALAAAHALLGEAGEIRFATRQAGIVSVARKADGGLELALPQIPVERQDWPEAAALLGGTPQETWRSSARYAVFAYADENAVRALQPDLAGLAVLGDHQFICTAPGSASDVVSRVFVPGAGNPEDSATGSAHAVLAPLWARRLGRDRFTALQASARGGTFACRVAGDRVWLGGTCVTVVEGAFYAAG